MQPQASGKEKARWPCGSGLKSEPEEERRRQTKS